MNPSRVDSGPANDYLFEVAFFERSFFDCDLERSSFDPDLRPGGRCSPKDEGPRRTLADEASFFALDALPRSAEALVCAAMGFDCAAVRLVFAPDASAGVVEVVAFAARGFG